MSKRPVLFLDSGVGGLPYYEWVMHRVYDRSLVYVADTEHFPYGDKPVETILSLAEELAVRIIESFDPALIVLSCNTLSVIALSMLRSRFPVPMVGVVPAVKPAAARSEKKRIGVIATKRTIEDVYLKQLIAEFASDCSVHPFADNGLVGFVETRILEADEEEKNNACAASVSYFKEAGIDALVLGCTHFIFLKNTFAGLLGGGVKVLDSVEGVGRQVLRLLIGDDHTGAEPGGRSAGLFVTSEAKGPFYRSLSSRFGIEYGGLLTSGVRL